MIGGRSTSCTRTSSKSIIPGTGSRVVNGYGATAGVAFVSFESKRDLPAFGGPRNTTCPAPCRGILNVPGAAFFGPRLFLLDLVGQFADLRLEVRLDLLAGLVLGQDHPHLPQGGELLLGRLRLLVPGLGVVVLRRQVDGHDDCSLERWFIRFHGPLVAA